MKTYQDIEYTVVDDWNFGYVNNLKRNRVDAIAAYCYNRQHMLRRENPELNGYNNLKDGNLIPESKFRTLTGLRQDFWKHAKRDNGAKTIEVVLTWNA